MPRNPLKTAKSDQFDDELMTSFKVRKGNEINDDDEL